MEIFSTSTQQESHCHSCKLLVKVTDSIVFVTDRIYFPFVTSAKVHEGKMLVARLVYLCAAD